MLYYRESVIYLVSSNESQNIYLSSKFVISKNKQAKHDKIFDYLLIFKKMITALLKPPLSQKRRVLPILDVFCLTQMAQNKIFYFYFK